MAVWYAGAYAPAYQTVIYTIFHVCLFLFSTCFGQLCAHHQENYCINATPVLCHSVGLVSRSICSCIPDGHLHNFSYMFISILYMFRATMCPSSGELLYQCDTWFMSLCGSGKQEHMLLEHMLLHTRRSSTQFFIYVYFYSLHVSGSHVPIIRRIIVSMRHLVYVTLCVWYAGAYASAYQTVIYTIFHVCLFLFSTCFGQPCAHHQENYCISAIHGLCHSV